MGAKPARGHTTVTGRSNTGRHRVVGPGRTPADSSCLAWCRSFGTSARPRSPRQALTQPKAKASRDESADSNPPICGPFRARLCDDGVPEHRGVPGSSPDLAMSRSSCEQATLQLSPSLPSTTRQGVRGFPRVLNPHATPAPDIRMPPDLPNAMSLGAGTWPGTVVALARHARLQAPSPRSRKFGVLDPHAKPVVRFVSGAMLRAMSNGDLAPEYARDPARRFR
jgi:hypothetical protein